MSKELLKQAADQIELLAKQAGELESQITGLRADNVKLASALDAQVKTAASHEDEKAKLAGIAKLAAAKLFDAGVLKTAGDVDKFATDVLDHGKALNALGNLVDRVGTIKQASVVTETPGREPEVQTADSVWDARILARSGK